MTTGEVKPAYSIACSATCIFLFLIVAALFRANVTENEITKFTDAMAYGDPGWIPGLLPAGLDPGRRQWLFQILTWPLLSNLGFLATSIAGRILSFGLYAWAFAALGRSLRIHPVLLVLVVLAMDYAPSIVAGEWLFHGFEPKTISYPLIFLSLSYVLRKEVNLRLVAFITGLAISFHPLVGLYGAFAIGGVILWQRRPEIRAQAGQALGVLLAAGAFALRPVAMHLFGSESANSATTDLLSSYIYVYLRGAHHLDPSSWNPAWWACFFAYLLGAALSYALLRWLRRENAVDSLAVFGVMALLPFFFGLIIAPYDTNGSLLQFYLFRFGDLILPFTAYILTALLLQRILVERRAIICSYTLWLILACTLAVKLPDFMKQLEVFRKFPGPAQGITSGYLEVARWVAENTQKTAQIVTPPLGFESFPWLSRRRIAGTFKQTNLSGTLQGWYERMTAIGNLEKPWKWRGLDLAPRLNLLYRQHQTARVEEFMTEFKADFFLTFADHTLSLPVAFKNSEYTVYAFPPKASK